MGLFLFMTKKQKLRALKKFQEALNGNNQSKMHEYYLFYEFQIDNMLKNLSIDLLDVNREIFNKLKTRLDAHNQLERGYVALPRWLFDDAIDFIIDEIENETN